MILQTQCDFIGTAYRQRFNSLSTLDQMSEAQPTRVHRQEKSNNFGWAHSKYGNLKLNQSALTLMIKTNHCPLPQG